MKDLQEDDKMFIHPTIARLLQDGQEARMRRRLAERRAVRDAEAARSDRTARMSAAAASVSLPQPAAETRQAAERKPAGSTSGCTESTATHRGVAARRPA